MIILKEKEFLHGGRKYIARLYKKDGNSQIIGAILPKDNEMAKINMKNIAREYLHQFVINIPTTADVNTHMAVKKLVEILDNKQMVQERHCEHKDKKSIVLLMCGKNKLCRKAKAKDLYNSCRFQKSLLYAKTITDYSNIYVLSAKHGLLRLEQEIEPYNKSISEMSKLEKEQWASMVIASLSEISDIKKDKYIFLTNNDYSETIIPFLNNVDLPLKNTLEKEHKDYFIKKLSEKGVS
jgi:hypothetical protein